MRKGGNFSELRKQNYIPFQIKIRKQQVFLYLLHDIYQNYSAF